MNDNKKTLIYCLFGLAIGGNAIIFIIGDECNDLEFMKEECNNGRLGWHLSFGGLIALFLILVLFFTNYESSQKVEDVR